MGVKDSIPVLPRPINDPVLSYIKDAGFLQVTRCKIQAFYFSKRVNAADSMAMKRVIAFARHLD